MKLYHLILSFLIFPTFLFGQSVPIEKKGVIYKDDFSLGFRINSMGWGMYGDIGKRLTVDKRKYWRIEIMELKHSKEFKQPTLFTSTGLSTSPSAKPYFFGKQNNFYTIHFSYNRSNTVAEKLLKNGVSIDLVYGAGVAMGILKPYYLDIIYQIDNSNRFYVQPEKYNPESTERFLDPGYIYGSSGFSYGLNEVKFRPGGYAKIGLSFDWATYDEVLKAFEVGFSLDAYISKAPIMITSRNHRFFPNFYLSFQLGRRW